MHQGSSLSPAPIPPVGGRGGAPIHDDALASRLRAGDPECLREIMQAHGPQLLSFTRRFTSDPGLSEEIVQDAFVTLWRRPDLFDPARGSLRSLLIGIVRHKAIDASRKKRPIPVEDPEVGGTPDASVLIDLRGDVRRALAVLSPIQREAIFLAYYGGLTYREVARHLGVPEGTAKTRLRDGLMRLRDLASAGALG